MRTSSIHQTLLILLLSIVFVILGGRVQSQVPEGFVEVSELIPDARIELRYFSTNNFIGDTINGYEACKLYSSKETATALLSAQRKFKRLGYGLKLFDAYRPQKAVDHFVSWAKVLDDTAMKTVFYPKIPKAELFKSGYIASKSGHSRGSTVDLTVVNLKTNEEVDMGSSFDLFDPISHHNSPLISDEQLKNRDLLKSILIESGFKSYSKEWWHYTLVDEPYPNTYFNFDIK